MTKPFPAPLGALLIFALLFAGPSTAQPLEDVLVPATTGGIATVDRALAKLSTHRRLLVIAAHPDDEDTSLLALVARGLGGEAAYLSLSRGEGGQNLIGTELGVGLGLIRSGELLSARRVDGARQFFTRAFDFGYTRSLEETLERWPREMLMEDALRVVRRFRPQVVVSIFPPTDRAGHGQHQAAGVVATALFGEASPEAVPGEAFAWQPQALYRAGWFDRTAEALELPLGVIDPLDGRSIIQLALASRSKHRSQDMGSLQEVGSRSNRLIPVAGTATREGEDPFADIDTRLEAMASILPAGEPRRQVEEHLRRAEAIARSTREALSPSRLDSAVAPLAKIAEHLEAARAHLGNPEPASPAEAVGELISEKLKVARMALSSAAGIVYDAFTDEETLVPGETVKLSARMWNGSSEALDIEPPTPEIPPGWVAQRIPSENDSGESPSARLEAGEAGTWEWQVEVPATAAASRPYFLELPLKGDVYDWSGAEERVRAEPFGPALLSVRFTSRLGGLRVHHERAAVHRYGDQARGEIRRPLRVVPALEVTVSPELRVWPTHRRDPIPLQVQLTNHRSENLQGALVLKVPEGWPKPEVYTFDLPANGRRSMDLSLRPPDPLAPDDYLLGAVAVVGDERFDLAVPLVSYEHIEARAWPRRAEALIRVGELTLPDVETVGYIRGASDRIPEALRDIGLPIEELSAEDLAVGNLGKYPVIVVGSRAYETHQALAEANDRLLGYAEEGGRLVVQYQQYQFVRGSFAPYSLEIARPHARITDETAQVTVLEPGHRYFHSPNEITKEDWEGWVQERGLYFPSTWDEAFTPLLAMADPDRPAEHGALLVAKVGRGTYTYTGLAFFRQLPAGVVGGYRLFLNLLSAGPRSRERHDD